MEPISEPSTRAREGKRTFLAFGGMAVLAVLLAAMTFNAFHSARERQLAERWQLHSMEVLLTAGQLRTALGEAFRAERGYLLTGDPRFLAAYRKSKAEVAPLLAEMRTLTRDNDGQRTAVDTLAREVPRYLALLDATVTPAANGDQAAAFLQRGVARREFEAMIEVLTRIDGEERRLLVLRAETHRRATAASEVGGYALAGLAFLFLFIVAGAAVAASAARKRSLAMEAQLRQLATTDELTGLLNRRAFLSALDAALTQAERDGAPTAIALVDLDHFKRVNDRYGHHCGDEVLRTFARVARETVRDGDLIGRLGGEEFGVLLPATSHAEAGILAERLRQALAARVIPLEAGAAVRATISIGVAQQLPGEPRDRMIVRADHALYEAKNAGRNQVRLAA